MSQIKHHSFDRSKSDPNIEYEQIENKSSWSLLEFSQFKHDEFNSENFKQTNLKDLKQIIQFKRESTKKLTLKKNKNATILTLRKNLNIRQYLQMKIYDL